MNRALQEKIAEFARKCAVHAFVASYDGNVSLRAKEGIYITATRTLKAEASINDVCLIDLNGKLIEGKRKPSTESLMHCYIYQNRKDVEGIVHTHPINTTAFAAARKPLDLAVFPEVILDLGAVPLAVYATPSTDEVARSLQPYVGWANAILLANHGVVCMGQDIEEAFYRTEKLEHAAKTLIASASIGGAVALSRAEVDRLYATHEEFKRRGEFSFTENESSKQSVSQIGASEKLVCHDCSDENIASSKENSPEHITEEIVRKVLRRL